uniref:Cobyrinic acid a,c-diamide synthase CbiA n=1 Tax=mine drainage metagenome TaxID=410659 RepID=E6Q1K3_9ZZZZ
MKSRALLISAAASGCGKTTVTLGLLRALRNRGLRVGAAKVGPDFIDSAFHRVAAGKRSATLDLWGMREQTLRAELAAVAAESDIVLVEGVMGLFDGARDGSGSSAQLAELLDLPVVLVLDVAAQATTAAAVAFGLARYHPNLRVVGAILNRVGSPGHAATIVPALDAIGLRCLGALAREGALALPERHLGLVQAREQRELESFLEAAAAACESQLDIDALLALASPLSDLAAPSEPPLAPLGARIAIADDLAFAFSYAHITEGWRRAGARLSFFSPLADEGPEREADAVYLPGGYPELHAAKLAAATNFRAGMEAARARGAAIYGECGGYMVLGESLADRDAREHAMLGFLPLRFSFAQPRMHLGYREVRPLADTPFARAGAPLRGHEFHFASVEREPEATALFETSEEGRGSLRLGMHEGNVLGSFLHLLDRLEA